MRKRQKLNPFIYNPLANWQEQVIRNSNRAIIISIIAILIAIVRLV